MSDETTQEMYADTLEQSFASEESADASTDAAESTSGESTATSAVETDDSVTVADTGSETSDSKPAASPVGYAPIAALQDERQKRQEAEVQLARLQGREEARAPADSTEEVEESDFWDDPKAAFDSLREQTEKQIANAVSNSEQKAWEARATRCERRATKAHSDYLDVRGVAMERMETDPAWATAVRASDDFQIDPAEAMYQATKALTAQATFDPKIERDKIRKELLAELNGDAVNADTSSLPKSQANSTGSGPTAEPAIPDEGDDSLRGALLDY